MKKLLAGLLLALLASSCGTMPINSSTPPASGTADDGLITQSLFDDKTASISEDRIQKILDGAYKLPQQLRVAIVRLEGKPARQRYLWNYRSDETHLKTQQSYLDSFAQKFRQSPRVTKLSVIPEMLLTDPASFTGIREAAVRMQADVVVVYAVTSDIYSKYKFFNKPDIKAFATTQLILLDVRTGLVPFSTIVTRDFIAKRTKEETGNEEAQSRIRHQAVLLTIDEIGRQLGELLAQR